ncbi:MAG: Gfo/Idh/MocA family oxidoreductase [Desulfobacterales bacterium]
MIQHPQLNVLCVTSESISILGPLLAYLKEIPHIQPVLLENLPKDLRQFHVVITEPVAKFHPDSKQLEQFVRSGGGWIGVVSLMDLPIPELFGALPGDVGPESEIRILFQDQDHPMTSRLPDAVYVKGRYHSFLSHSQDVTTLLYADWHHHHHPVLVHRQVDAGQVACTTLQDFENPGLRQIMYRLLRQISGQTRTSQKLNVGILGYAPSVGELHGRGVLSTDGLNLHTVCDLNPQRLKIAEQQFLGIKTYSHASELANDDEVDLVIVATPPNSHAELCIEMIAQNKHVVCEKPLALNRRETDRMLEMAEKSKVHLSCHQNRRWDPDYLAIKRALHEGLIGDLFYMETFVGGFSHPCGYWHSHEEISGGTTYDWGAHYLDWIVDLIPDRPESVIGFRHKRIWHDVTNADQERIWIKFEGGKEAEFIHSDIAAARKPKWYLLGTKGAIVGNWKDVATYYIDPLLYFHKHRIPATEMAPELTLYQRQATGQIVEQKIAIPERKDYAFHRNLADHLLIGEPLASSLEDSVKVVSILETAARSAKKGGTMEKFHDF